MGSCLIVLCSDLERFNVVFISDCGCESVIDVFLFVSFLFSVHHVSLSFSTSHIIVVDYKLIEKSKWWV